MKLVVSVADYGMTEGITDGALRAIRDGIVTDVGIMTNNPSCVRAAEEIKKYPHVSVGMDVNIVSGVPVTDPKLVPSLVDENGVLIRSVVRKKKNLLEMPYEELYLEVENQVKRFMELFDGKKPAYMLGHSFVSQNFLKACILIGEKYNIPTNIDTVARCNEIPIEGFEKTCNIVRPKGSYYTVEDKEAFNKGTAQREVDVIGFITQDKGQLLKNEYSLLRMHIGYPDADLYKMSTYNDVRCIEMSAACSKEVKDWVKENNIELINFDQFFKERPYREYDEKLR